MIVKNEVLSVVKLYKKLIDLNVKFETIIKVVLYI